MHPKNKSLEVGFGKLSVIRKPRPLGEIPNFRDVII